MIWFAIGWLSCFALVLELAHRAPARDDLE
jgi:hypothetical protein